MQRRQDVTPQQLADAFRRQAGAKEYERDDLIIDLHARIETMFADVIENAFGILKADSPEKWMMSREI